MSNFGLPMKAKKEWYSSKFFAFAGGFEICIRVDTCTARYNNSNNGHVTVSLHKVDSPYDADLLENIP